MNAPIVVGGKSPHSRPIQNRKPHGRSRLTNKKDLLPGVDGRTVVYRRFRDIASQVALDQGGLDQLSEARLQLVRRFAAAAVLAEQIEALLPMARRSTSPSMDCSVARWSASPSASESTGYRATFR